MANHPDRASAQINNGKAVAHAPLDESSSMASQDSTNFNRSTPSGLRTGICHSQLMLKHWKPDIQFDHNNDDDDDDDEPERPSRITRIMAQVSS